MEKQISVTAQTEKAEQMEKILTMDRRNRRARLRIRHGASGRPFARVRSGLPTGTPPHFAAWMADLNAKSAMQNLKTADLADATVGDLASAWALLSIGGFKSVWSVAQADITNLMRVNGIGLKRLEKVEAYLKDRRVPLKWTAA